MIWLNWGPINTNSNLLYLNAKCNTTLIKQKNISSTIIQIYSLLKTQQIARWNDKNKFTAHWLIAGPRVEFVWFKANSGRIYWTTFINFYTEQQTLRKLSLKCLKKKKKSDKTDEGQIKCMKLTDTTCHVQFKL